MANKRINELEERDYQQAVSNNDYFMVDGESLDEAKKILVSNFASIELVNSGFNTLNASARKIVSDINDFKSKIPTIETGTNNNIRVDLDEDSQVYTFYGSAYDVISQDEKLKVETATNGYTKTFKLSADTYTKSYIDEKISDLIGNYDVEGLNNIVVERGTFGGEDSITYIISLDGITAAKADESIVDGDTVVENLSVSINDTNMAYNTSLTQGSYNSANGYSLSQGLRNISLSNSFAQGVDNSAGECSLSQGEENYAATYSLAQGSYNTANNHSLSQGKGNSADNYSMSIGAYVTALDYSVAFAGNDEYNNKTSAIDYSMAFGGNAFASVSSINFYGDSATNNSVSIGHNGLVSNHTTAMGNYNEPKYVSGDYPYTFALGDGTEDKPHTYFWVNQESVYYSKSEGEVVDLVKNVESKTILCDDLETYYNIKDKPENLHKVFIVG